MESISGTVVRMFSVGSVILNRRASGESSNEQTHNVGEQQSGDDCEDQGQTPILETPSLVVTGSKSEWNPPS